MQRASVLASEPERPPAELTAACYVGCSGWFYWNWRKGIYPPGSQPNEWFDHYARSFNTVELNAPYYSWPTITAVKSWRSQARRGFVYSVKVNELITHTRRFSLIVADRSWDVFCSSFRGALSTRAPGWTGFSPSSTQGGGTSWSSGTRAGG